MRFFVAVALLAMVSAECLPSGLTDSCSPWSPAQCDDPTLGGQFGCGYDTNQTKCVQTTNCTAFATQTTCQAGVSGACVWNEPNVCDTYDILTCSGNRSRYATCLRVDSTVYLETLYGSTNLTETEIQANVNAVVDQSICGCLNEYFSCIYEGECGRDAQWLRGWGAACNLVFDALLQSRPTLSCPRTWCNIGRTVAVSTFTATFTFAAGQLPSSWTQPRRDAFLRAIASLSGVNIGWITFDAATSTITVTIPSQAVMSSDQLNQLKNTWLSLSSSSSAAFPVFASMGVQSTQTTAQAAQVQSPTPAPPAPAPTAISSGSRLLIGAGLWLSLLVSQLLF